MKKPRPLPTLPVLPEPLADEIRRMDRRLLPHQLDDLIARLCAWQPLRLQELAALLNRSPVYLQNTAIKRLMRSGRLRFRHAGQPNHPHQAYTAVETAALAQTATPPPVEDPPALDIGRND